MDIDNIFDKYELIEEKLVEYGFIKNKDEYTLKKDLDEEFFLKIMIKKPNINLKVYEKDTNEEYLPFNISTVTGSYISKVREKTATIINDVIDKCFTSSNIKEELLKYTKEEFKTKEDYPWEDHKSYCTLKVNDKWYCLFMNIPYKSLGIDKANNIDVINLKNDPNKIENLIDNKTFFKAYHMNKKYWYTVKLSNDVDLDLIKKLIKESYEIVKNK